MYHWFLYLFAIIFKSCISTYFINLMHNNVTLLKIGGAIEHTIIINLEITFLA